MPGGIGIVAGSISYSVLLKIMKTKFVGGGIVLCFYLCLESQRGKAWEIGKAILRVKGMTIHSKNITTTRIISNDFSYLMELLEGNTEPKHSDVY